MAPTHHPPPACDVPVVLCKIGLMNMEVVTRLRGGGCGGSKSAVSVKPVPAVGLPAAAKAQTQRKQEIEKEIEGLKTALAAERERSQWQAQGLACFQPCLAPVATAPVAMKSAPSAARRGSVASRPFDKTRGSGRALGGLSLSVVIFGATGDLARKKLFRHCTSLYCMATCPASASTSSAMGAAQLS